MTFSITDRICKIIENHAGSIPSEWKEKFREGLVRENENRVRMINKVLLILDIILIFIDVFLYRNKWTSSIGYRRLFFSHTIMLIIFIAYLKLPFIKMDIKARRYAYIIYISSIMLWCAFMAINAQTIHGQVSAYIVACFCMASGFVLKKKESFPILFTFFSITILGTYAMKGAEGMLHNLINLTFPVALSYIISATCYNSYVRDYINRKTILKQKEELEATKARLEEIVDIRSAELFRANKMLLEEVNRRQEAEAESLTAIKKYEEKLKVIDETKEYERARSNFFANLSHELRTPVNIIYSALQMMEFLTRGEKCENAVKLSKHMGIIKQNCYRLIRLVGNLIDVTKIDAEHYTINPRNIDIVKIVENITLSISEYVESKQLNLIFDTEIEEKIIGCDPDMIERIMLNLLSNAVKFTPEKGYIYVDISLDDNLIRISVRDTGIGIPKDKQSRIFERYVQNGEISSNGMQGSGIGLSLVKSIVEMYGGSIRLKSECGKGSEFIIELPDKTLEGDAEEAAAAVDIRAGNIDKISIEFSDIYF
ncbi:MAG: ATP-binding protein [Bacillota bacterium]